MNYYKKKLLNNGLKYFFIFLAFFIIFFLYQSFVINGNQAFQILVESAIFILFIVSVYNIRLGFYIFIFLIPLVNSLPEISGAKYFMLLMLLFFGVFLAFIINKGNEEQGSFSNKITNIVNKNFYYKNGTSIYGKVRFFDNELTLLVITIISVFIISLIITILRYANFYPFTTNNYHNLFINIKGITSNFAIPWVIDSFFNYSIGFAVILVAYNVINKMEHIIDILNILIVSTFLSVFIVIYQKFFNPTFGIPVIWTNSGRFNGTLSDPNALGAYCVLMFPIFFIMIFYYKNIFKKILYFILLVFFSLLVYFSGSRSSLVGILISLVIFFIYFLIFLIKRISHQHLKKKILTISIIIICFLVIFTGFSIVLSKDSIRNSILKSGVVNRTYETIEAFKLHLEKDGFVEALKSISNYRYIYWERAYQMGRDYPYSGVGIGSYILELPDYNYRYNRGFQNEDYAGNYYLQLFAEFGIVGLVLVGAFLVIVIKKYIVFNKSRKLNLVFLSLFVSFLSMLVILTFGPHTNFIEVQITFYLIIALILSFIKVEDNGSYLYEDKDILRKKSIRANYGVFGIAASIIIILIFSYNFLGASLGPLSLNIKENVCGWQDKGISNTYGLYDEEGYGESSPRWTQIDAHINYKKNGEKFVIPLKASNPDIYENPLFVKIYIDNKMVINLKLNDDKWHKLIIKLPSNDMSKFNLTLVCSRDWVPKEWGISSDSRRLGVMIGAIEFTD